MKNRKLEAGTQLLSGLGDAKTGVAGRNSEEALNAKTEQSTEVEIMDKDRVKGAADDAAGRVERQAGEWTGDNKAQAEGAARQIKGKAEKFAGDVKDTARDANAHSKQDEESTRVHKPDEHTRRTGTHGD